MRGRSTVGRRARVATSALAGLLLLACQAGPPSPKPSEAVASDMAPAVSAEPTSPPRLIPVRSAQTTVSPSSAATWMAVEGGFFRDQGLDVELIGVEPGAPFLAALHSGQLDISG